MKLNVLPTERFSCHSCTDCCRNQMVELIVGEPEKLDRLQWPAGDPLRDVKGYFKHAGKSYMAHRPDGACVYLNQSNGLCRIHETFGPESKCQACRIFPFQITPSFAGEASVTARFDCPTVRKNEGEPHTESLPLLRTYTDRWVAEDGFDESIRCGLRRDQMEAVSDFVATLLNAFSTNVGRATFILFLCDTLALTAVDEIDREALGSTFAPLKKLVDASAAAPAKRPGMMHRAAFRTLLALYLRRDEDVIDRKASRFGRLITMTAFVLGFGSFRGLGRVHPAGPLRRARLFKPTSPPGVDQCSLLWRLVRIRLEAMQFLGAANGGRDFLTGLRSLALLYPLTMAAAKQSAASRGNTSVDEKDVDYAVSAIEHSFGRQAALAQPFARRLESLLLLDAAIFPRLAATI